MQTANYLKGIANTKGLIHHSLLTIHCYPISTNSISKTNSSPAKK